jgi:hypothetical protein
MTEFGVQSTGRGGKIPSHCPIPDACQNLVGYGSGRSGNCVNQNLGSEDFDLVSALCHGRRNVADVDSQHVHRNATDERARMAAKR